MMYTFIGNYYNGISSVRISNLTVRNTNQVFLYDITKSWLFNVTNLITTG